MRYQCLWSTISPFPELVFLIVFPLLWTALKENSFPIFLGGICFHFFPCVSKRFQFSFFFLQTACIGTAHCRWSETISPLKKNSWWNYIKKNLQKSSRRLCPIMDCSTGERILIYIFLKKLRSGKKNPDGSIDIVWRKLLFQKSVDQFSYLGPRLQISFYSETIR